MEEDRIDLKIKTKSEVLIELNAKINEARDEAERIRVNFASEMEKRQAEYLERMAEYEVKLSNPERSLIEIKAELAAAERSIDDWRDQIQLLATEVKQAEDGLVAKEQELQASEQELIKEWRSYLVTTTANLKSETETLKKRAEVLDSRTELVNMRHRQLNDQMKLLKATQAEILNKK
jgi:uncharacterized coiled-coil protein SlyX